MIKISINPIVHVIYTIYLPDQMGEYYITDMAEQFKTKVMDPDVVVVLYDNYNDIMLGKDFKQNQFIQVGYEVGGTVEPFVQSFISELKAYDKVQVICSRDEAGVLKISSIVNNILDDITDKEELLYTYRTMLDNLGVDIDITDKLVNAIGQGSLDLSIYEEEKVVIERNVDVAPRAPKVEEVVEEEIIPEEVVEEAPVEEIVETTTIPNESESIEKEIDVNHMFKNICEEYNISVYDAIKKIFDTILGPLEDNETTVVEEIVEDVVEVDDSEPLEEDITEEEYTEYSSMESMMSYSIEASQLGSERALELVKRISKNWSNDIVPNIIDKIEALNFFKNNTNKFKINKSDKIEEAVAKAAGNVVSVELLKKNLSKWKNDDEDWKTSDNKKIKKNQRAWTKEYVKFKNDISSIIKSALSLILNNDEEVGVTDTKESLDVAVYSKKQKEEKASHAVETITEETNIYNMVSLESLKEQVNNDTELFNLILDTENLENKEEVLNQAAQYNIFDGMTKLPLTDSIKRRVAITNIKYN